MTKSLSLTLVLLFLTQVLVSAGFELAHDEAYYWLFSRQLDWGYFDHPPVVALVIRAFSFLPDSEFSVRIGFILMQFLTLFCLFGMVEKKNWTRTTLLFFAFPLASLTGLLALPDMPLLFTTGLYCLCLKRFFENKTAVHSLVLALVIALLLYSKYHGILLVFFTVLALPRLLLEKKFYLIAGLSLLLFLPHIWWQYEHDFATLRYHFMERPSSSFKFGRSLEFLGIQIILAGLFAGPIVWWTALKEKRKDDFGRAMQFISLGTVIFFLVSTFSKKFEANWTIFLTVPLIYLCVTSPLWEKRFVRSLLYGSLAIVMAVRFLVFLPVEGRAFRRLNEVKGWEVWAKSVKEQCPGRLVANTYQMASKLSYYLGEPVPALNFRSRKNQFEIWNWQENWPSGVVCYVTDKKEFQGEHLETPEEDELKLVKGITLEELLKRKAELKR